MSKPTGEFSRDASNRLRYALPQDDASDYAGLVAQIAANFNLRPVTDLVRGLDEMFAEYTDGHHTISLEWDIWMGFAVVAHTPEAEPLVNSIAASLTVS